MKKILIILTMLILLSACQKESNYDKKIGNAKSMNEVIEINNEEITVKNVWKSTLEQSTIEGEDIIYIYMDINPDSAFSSAELWILLEDDTKINAYLIDGLDYLVGDQRAEDPYVRFSIPKDTMSCLLFFNEEVFVEINM
ncbi:lipoprotein [Mycoplasmatota bacterium]|nr:lipoprotein [Mycoplasmatota bacterium]